MVAAGVVAGLIVGDVFGGYSKTVQQATLILAMAFSLTEISFRGISPKAELRGIALALLMSYGVLGGIVLVYGLLSPDPGIRSGWVLMAAVPPAIAVVPITSLLGGNVRRALISDAVLYVLGLLTVPGLSLLFLGEAVPVGDLVVQTLLLIGLPILLSRPLRRWDGVHEARPVAVSVSFFFLVAAIAGSTRGALLGRPDLVAGLIVLGFLRTFGLGFLILAVGRLAHVSREQGIAGVTFASFKNLGLTVVLAFSFFGAVASLPSIVCLIVEILWIAALPFVFRPGARAGPPVPERADQRASTRDPK